MEHTVPKTNSDCACICRSQPENKRTAAAIKVLQTIFAAAILVMDTVTLVRQYCNFFVDDYSYQVDDPENAGYDSDKAVVAYKNQRRDLDYADYDRDQASACYAAQDSVDVADDDQDDFYNPAQALQT
jgi:hypothetical protein